MLTLGHVLTALTGQPHQNSSTPVLTDAVVDSRLASPGALFIALPGEHTDGHNYVESAVQQGASVALVQQPVADLPTLDLRQPGPYTLPDLSHPICIQVADTLQALQQLARYWRRQFSELTVVGITGSVGKTTTKELVAAVLQAQFRTLKTVGNLNNEIGLPLTVLRLTPAHQLAVLEMGFYQLGEIDFLCEIAQPQIGVVNNVYPVHLERAGSLENIQQGKGELIAALPAKNGIGILNYDEPLVLAMQARNPDIQYLTYGLDPKATLWADEVQGLGLNGVRFQVHYGNQHMYMNVPLLGRHSVHTALRAAAVGLAAGMDWELIATGLQSLHAQNQLRLVAVRGPKGSLFIDDTYNASPESTIAALNLLAELQASRRIAVLGDMLELGTYEADGHQRVGIRAREVADILITVGPRAEMIANSARAAGLDETQVHTLAESSAARDLLNSMVTHGDVVLVKGSRATHLDRLVQTLEVVE